MLEFNGLIFLDSRFRGNDDNGSVIFYGFITIKGMIIKFVLNGGKNLGLEMGISGIDYAAPV